MAKTSDTPLILDTPSEITARVQRIENAIPDLLADYDQTVAEQKQADADAVAKQIADEASAAAAPPVAEKPAASESDKK